MFSTRRVALVLFFSSLAIQATTAQPADFETRLTAIRAVTVRTLQYVTKALPPQGSDRPSHVTVRDTGMAALTNLDIGGPLNTTQNWLRAVFQLQDPTTGNMPWDFSGEVDDANSIEFGVQSWPPIAINYATQMASFMPEFIPHMRLAVKALQAHQVSVAYTNVYLSNAVSQLLFGEILTDAAITSNAISILKNWATFTQNNGVGEFDSPTYYGEDLNALSLGYSCSKNLEARNILLWGLKYIWVDIAANWFNPQQSLSGSHSRDYDFLFGTGEVYAWLYAEGWVSELNRAVEVKQILVESLKYPVTAFHPDSDMRLLAQIPDKLVMSRHSPAPRPNSSVIPPTYIRTNRITPDFAAGSIDFNYGPQDKLMVWHLSNNCSFSVISIVPDTGNNPYGKVRTPDNDGHLKPSHMALGPTVVQSDAAMLILLDLDPTVLFPNYNCLATNILLPLDADAILCNGQLAPNEFFTTPAVIPISLNDVITVRVASGCVSFRIFYVTEQIGTIAPTFLLQSESTGFSAGAVRLTIYHTSPNVPNASPPANVNHIRVGIISLSESCSAETTLNLSQRLAAVQVSSTLNLTTGPSGLWTATAQFLSVQLSVGKSMGSDRATVFRRINGSDIVPPPVGGITVNGVTIDPTQPLGPQINNMATLTPPSGTSTNNSKPSGSVNIPQGKVPSATSLRKDLLECVAWTAMIAAVAVVLANL